MANTPLLGHTDEDAYWDTFVLEEHSTPFTRLDTTVDDILLQNPNGLIRHLATHGVVKVSEFRVPEHVILKHGILDGDSIVTFGSPTPRLNYEVAWKSVLESMAPTHVDGWSTSSDVSIPVIAYTCSVKNEEIGSRRGLLHVLIGKYFQGGCRMNVFALPAVHAVIDYKWSLFAKNLLLAEFACYLAWVLGFYVFTVAFQDEDISQSLSQIVFQTRNGKIAILGNVVALVGMIPFVLIEYSTVVAYGWRAWATVWNVLDSTTYILQLYIIICHTCRIGLEQGGISTACAILSIILLFRLQYFSRVFPNTRFSFVDDIKAVLSDVKYYIVFLVVIIAGYAAAFHILFRFDQERHEEFSSYGKAFLQMVSWSFSGPELMELIEDTQNPVMAYILGVSFAFIMGMILINMLIGLMTASLETMSSRSDLRSLLSKAIVIDELEMTIPGWMYSRMGISSGACIHVLRIDPDALDDTVKDSLWPYSADVETDDGTNTTSKTMEDIDKNICELREQVIALQNSINQLVQRDLLGK